MADKLGLGSEVRELKIGQSFTNAKSTAFHAIRYDFKPASVDVNKIATVDIGNNNQVTVTVPHLGSPNQSRRKDLRKHQFYVIVDGAGTPQTVFKGSQRPFNKECVLIIDKKTGDITLEKLSNNIQVKKTRSELIKPPLHADRGGQSQSNDRSSLGAPNTQGPPIGQRTSNKTRVTSGSRRADRPITHLIPKHSPLRASPNYPSPGHHKSPKRDRDLHVSPETHGSQNTLASLPMIGIDDFSDPIVPSTQPSNVQSIVEKSPIINISDNENGVQEMSDTSSSSNSSDSDSDNERTLVSKPALDRANGHTNGLPSISMASKAPMPAHILKEDLCLSSESESDSD